MRTHALSTLPTFNGPKRNEVPLGTWSMGWTHHGSGAKQSFCGSRLRTRQHRHMFSHSCFFVRSFRICKNGYKGFQRCHTDTNHMIIIWYLQYLCTQYYVLTICDVSESWIIKNAHRSWQFLGEICLIFFSIATRFQKMAEQHEVGLNNSRTGALNKSESRHPPVIPWNTML